MPQHENIKCPRCSTEFECKLGNISECQCTQVSLSYEEQLFIEEKYNDCLCVKCLQTLQFQYKLYRNHIFRI